MESSRPSFGIMSGVATFLGLSPHLLVLSALLVFRPPSATTGSIVMFTVGAKLLVECVFYQFFSNQMKSQKIMKGWEEVVSVPLLSHPNVSLSIFFYFIDHVCDILILYKALQTPFYPPLIFFVFLGCQAAASYVQGRISDLVSLKKSLLFALSAAFLALLGIEFVGMISPNSNSFSISTLPSNFAGLNLLEPSTQILILMVGKGLFGNISTLSRSAIASVVFAEAMRKFSKKGV
ncbi:MAG: hypothetical protein SNF33_00175 (plasmid) [Candidatus Algichlamydia australiensis]|nr:hypothetical protein [Chlamydiales bacterium]